MNIQELRIGNRLKEGIVEHIGWRDGYYTVGCMKTGFEAVATFYDSDDIHQIPITEELLLKCGFKKKNGYKFVLPNLHFSLVRIDSMTREEYAFSHYNLWVNLEYLHQLQKLYFAFKGQELEIDL